MSDDIVAGKITEKVQLAIFEIMDLAIRSTNERSALVFVTFNPSEFWLVVSVYPSYGKTMGPIPGGQSTIDDGQNTVFKTVVPLDYKHSDPIRELNRARAFINTYCQPRSKPVETV